MLQELLNKFDLIAGTEILLVGLTIKLIVSQWYPPIQKSLQSLFCIGIGSGFGYFLNPTKEGLVLAIIASSFAFYGGELIGAFKKLTSELHDDRLNYKSNGTNARRNKLK